MYTPSANGALAITFKSGQKYWFFNTFGTKWLATSIAIFLSLTIVFLMLFKKTAAIAALVFVSFYALAQVDNRNAQTPKMLDPANIDTTVQPGDNFYLFSNGSWLKNNPIPESAPYWSAYGEARERLNGNLHSLLTDAANAKNAAKGSSLQKLGDFFRSGMDSVNIDKAGLLPIHEFLEHIDKIRSKSDLISEIAYEHTIGLDVLFLFGILPDNKNSSKEQCKFFQGDLGMPTREHYFNMDDHTVKVREAYKKYIQQIFKLIGDDSLSALRDASEVYSLEELLAKASLSRVEIREAFLADTQYHVNSIAEINKLTPGFDWTVLLKGLKVNGVDTVSISQLSYFIESTKLLTTKPLRIWKKYLKFYFVNNMSQYLSSNFDNAHFNFYGKILSGQKVQKPRWRRVLQVIDGSIGNILGELYVNKCFSSESKKRVLNLVTNLQQAFSERIQKLAWMSAETKKEALVKLNALTKKIGYPDKWTDYGSLAISGNDYVKNVIRASQWQYDNDIKKWGKPVDRGVWSGSPYTVDAWANGSFIEIGFPAGILQYPFYDPSSDDAVNYGAIGCIIGHEMTHHFDNAGRLFDAVGNRRNWWNSADSENFTVKSNALVRQFEAIIVIDTFHANGKLTESEDISDLGGINIAYEAFKKTAQGRSDEKIDGFTPDQRFFLSWARVCRANIRQEELMNRLKTDGHSPTMLRCNVPLSNIDAWYKAFNVKTTDKMYRKTEDRVKIW